LSVVRLFERLSPNDTKRKSSSLQIQIIAAWELQFLCPLCKVGQKVWPRTNDIFLWMQKHHVDHNNTEHFSSFQHHHSLSRAKQISGA
jgi:hypothetical protein